MGKSRHYKELLDLITKASYRHSKWQVFSDFVEMSAISLSNAVDWANKEEREKRYLEIINSYEKKEQMLFPEMFACLVMALEYELKTNGPTDILGSVFHELELHNKWKGQFFTPVHVCDFMGAMVVPDKKELIEEKGFVSVAEPCVGSGAMVLGFAKAMQTNKMNYCSQMVVTAIDLDLKCVHMAYLQFSLYGIPAVIIHGNSLTMQEWSKWYTPTYMIDGWMFKNLNTEITNKNTEITNKNTKNTNKNTESTSNNTENAKKNTNIEQMSMFDIKF